MKFKTLVNILQTYSSTFELTLTTIARILEETTRQYELQALSSQINPHFLYNTLDTIIWMAEFQDSQRVVQVTKSLATYFRLALIRVKI